MIFISNYLKNKIVTYSHKNKHNIVFILDKYDKALGNSINKYNDIFH